MCACCQPRPVADSWRFKDMVDLQLSATWPTAAGKLDKVGKSQDNPLCELPIECSGLCTKVYYHE